jgi:hypothetical protein
MVLSSLRYTAELPDEDVIAIAELAVARGTTLGEELHEAIEAHVGKAKGDDKKHLAAVGAVAEEKGK